MTRLCLSRHSGYVLVCRLSWQRRGGSSLYVFRVLCLCWRSSALGNSTHNFRRRLECTFLVEHVVAHACHGQARASISSVGHLIECTVVGPQGLGSPPTHCVVLSHLFISTRGRARVVGIPYTRTPSTSRVAFLIHPIRHFLFGATLWGSPRPLSFLGVSVRHVMGRSSKAMFGALGEGRPPLLHGVPHSRGCLRQSICFHVPPCSLGVAFWGCHFAVAWCSPIFAPRDVVR